MTLLEVKSKRHMSPSRSPPKMASAALLVWANSARAVIFASPLGVVVLPTPVPILSSMVPSAASTTYKYPLPSPGLTLL